MSYILGDIADKVRSRVRDTSFSPSETTGYINDAQNAVFNEFRLPFMEATQAYTLTTGNADITNGGTLPSNFVEPISLILTTNGRETVLTPRDYREMDALHPDYEASTEPRGVPSEWYKYAQTIRVYPEPDAAYTLTLRYYKRPTLLSADADVPELPAEFEELLVVGAGYRILQVKDNYDQAAILENRYRELAQQLVTRYSGNQAGQPTIMRVNRNAVGKRHY